MLQFLRRKRKCGIIKYLTVNCNRSGTKLDEVLFSFDIELRLVGQVKRLYDDVKLYGTSCRVETSMKRNEVIEELE